jgi:BolA protein
MRGYIPLCDLGKTNNDILTSGLLVPERFLHQDNQAFHTAWCSFSGYADLENQENLVLGLFLASFVYYGASHGLSQALREGKIMKMEQKITDRLQEALNPTHLAVINESHLHQGHAGDDGSGESHFRVEISSSQFKGSTRVAQQREIYSALVNEMKIIHALSIQINTT